MKKLATAAALAAALWAGAAASPALAEELACPKVGGWIDGRTGAPVSPAVAFDRMATADVVLLGEHHAMADIHLWQAAVAAGVASRRPTQYAYEMFPRASQPALDAWSRGETSRHDFLVASGWGDVWGFRAAAYDPILRLPRLQAAPAIALNVDRALVRRVGVQGWKAVPEAEREGLTDPAPALPEYIETLDRVMAMKSARDEASRPAKEARRQRFVEAQLVWDRAFAEAIVAGLEKAPERAVIAFMGRGHVDYGHGAAHQLADLGVFNAVSAVPVRVTEDCAVKYDAAGRPLADLVYGVPPYQPEPDGARQPRPRIGVFIQDAEGGGAEITRVSDDSPAEAAGFAAGDVVTAVAGKSVANAAELGRAIRSHTWGAWLPIAVKRGDETLELVARLPVAPEDR